jgi:hypothetical protein
VTSTSPIRDLFVSDVTRDIPPVVYFHEQSPEKLAAEVAEYIVTGGWPEDHPNHRRVPNGIHEQYVRLLTNMAAELDRAGGPDLPTVWISGFYGSGKSSFAKLLGLALNDTTLPDGTLLADAWVKRDTSPRANELREAWRALRAKVDPLAVVFDIGSIARDNEQIHAAAVRQVQKRLGYCGAEPLVADYELRLERAGEWARFEAAAEATLGQPWTAAKDKPLAEDEFSHVLSVMFPQRYPDPTSWFTARAGDTSRADSPDEAVAAIRDMLAFRRPGATLFLVVDEVSQYVRDNKDRIDRLRAFATALGATLRGKAWLIALGQQKLDEEAGDAFLVWAKDRFPPKLRAHLAATNIRDVVHRRLLQKTPAAESTLRALFEQHRPELKLYAHGCEDVTPDELVDVYPMLPGQIELILQITSALRTRSQRAQGDDQAIRGLLQLLGELFRDQKLADKPVGSLVTLDQMYEVQHTALDSDTQASMARLLAQCDDERERLHVRAAKAVALLEQIQEMTPTDPKLVAQCLYDRLDAGNRLPAVTEALDELRRRGLLGYSEKSGYKIQSSAGEEWDRERRDVPVTRDTIGELVKGELEYLVALPDRPKLQGRPFPWSGVFSDGRRIDNAPLLPSRDESAIVVDCRFLVVEERGESVWVRRSDEEALRDRLLWVAGDTEQAEHEARELAKSRQMVRKYKPRRESLPAPRKLLLQQEENRSEDLAKRLRDAVAAAWMAGRIYFRARPIMPAEQGAAFATALHAAATRVLPDLYPHFIATQVEPKELLQLVQPELSGPSPKFLDGDLGLLELDAGRFVPASNGVVPRRVKEYIDAEGAVSGAALFAHFGGPPFGYTANVVKACVAALLRGGKVRLRPDSGLEIAAIRDAGVLDLFGKDSDRAFKRATIVPAGQDDIGFTARARICAFFEDALGHRMDREDDAIANAVAEFFPRLAQRLRSVQGGLNRLPGSPEGPAELSRLAAALEECIRACRQTKPTVALVKSRLETLRDGVRLLRLFEHELTDPAIRAVSSAHDVVTHQASQLDALGTDASNVRDAAARARAQLARERSWIGIGELDSDVASIRAAYSAERQRLLQWQELETEAAKGRITARSGFEKLTVEERHRVFRPLTQAMPATDPDAVAPALVDLKDPFTVRLQRAEDESNALVDELVSDRSKLPIVVVDLRLRNRELSTAEDVEALIAEVRARLLEQIGRGVRVRLP